MSNKQVTVYLQAASGQLKEAGKVDYAKITHVSGLAECRLRHTSGKTLIMKESEVDFDALKFLVGWIAQYNINKPAAEQYLRTSAIQSPLSDPKSKTYDLEIDDIVKVHSATYALHVHRYIKGEDLHEAIRIYIKEQPLTADQFLMLHEWLDFAKGDLLKCAVNTVAFKKVFGPGPAEYDGILEIAAKFDVKAEMERLVAMHEANKRRQEATRAHHEERRAKQAAWQQQKKEENETRKEWSKDVSKNGWAAAAKKGGNGKKSGQ